MTQHVFLFDLDGTLVDNFDAIYASYCHALGRLGLPPVSFDVVRRTVGGSVPITMRRLLQDRFTESAVDYFREYFQDHFTLGLRLLPGAREIVEALHARGHRLGVFTNKSHLQSRRVCEHLGIAHFFFAIEGAERPEGYRKPNPDFSQFILRRMESAPADTIMIGDSPFDVQAARIVAMRAVHLVATGSHSLEDLRAHTDADSVHPDLPTLGRLQLGLPL